MLGSKIYDSGENRKIHLHGIPRLTFKQKNRVVGVMTQLNVFIGPDEEIDFTVRHRIGNMFDRDDFRFISLISISTYRDGSPSWELDSLEI